MDEEDAVYKTKIILNKEKEVSSYKKIVELSENILVQELIFENNTYIKKRVFTLRN